MAVQAQFLAHAFPHESRATTRPALDNATIASSVYLGEPVTVQQQACGNNTTVFSDPRSELTCNNNYYYSNDSGCFVPRKRARLGDAGACVAMPVEGHAVALLPQAFAAEADLQMMSRAHGSGAASTSGRPDTAAPASLQQGILSQLHRHNVEVDALLRIENERLRAGLEEARHRHLRAVVSAVERTAAPRLRAAEAELERATARNAELSEKLQQMCAEGQAWQGVANGHEAAAAGLRATIEQLLQSPRAGGAEGEAEDAQSCCFEQPEEVADVKAGTRRLCKECGEADACVLLLPCRHLCLCGECEAAVEACPVCAATKNASLHVLLS